MWVAAVNNKIKLTDTKAKLGKMLLWLHWAACNFYLAFLIRLFPVIFHLMVFPPRHIENKLVFKSEISESIFIATFNLEVEYWTACKCQVYKAKIRL